MTSKGVMRMENFAERLRKLRNLESLTQEALAEKLGVSSQAVSKWERGRSLPDLSYILPLANIFHVTTDELLGNVRRRENWEEKWQEALRTGGEGAATETAKLAVKELYGDWKFRYREASGEYIAAQSMADEAEKKRCLASSEAHFRAMLRDWPESETAASMLVYVLAALERHQEAQSLAESLPSRDRLLLQVLQGKALEKQKLRVLSLSAMEFVSNLCSLPHSFAALDFAEHILREAPWDREDRGDLLVGVCWHRAVLYCESGDLDSAMEALQEIPSVLHELDETEKMQNATHEERYLIQIAETRSNSEHWKRACDSLELPQQLANLRKREDYRALVRELRMHF